MFRRFSRCWLQPLPPCFNAIFRKDKKRARKIFRLKLKAKRRMLREDSLYFAYVAMSNVDFGCLLQQAYPLRTPHVLYRSLLINCIRCQEQTVREILRSCPEFAPRRQAWLAIYRFMKAETDAARLMWIKAGWPWARPEGRTSEGLACARPF